MTESKQKPGGCLKMAGIIILTIIISVGGTFWILTKYVFPRQFEPVELSKKEQTRLETKLEAFRGWGSQLTGGKSTSPQDLGQPLQPEKYSENSNDRHIELNERELNAMLANNTDLAQRLAIDLSKDLVSAKLLIPLSPDFPVMGGKTLKLSTGIELAYANQRPIVILKGVSVMGISVPNAWLGNLKNIDLISEFGDARFWQAFADGVERIRVEDSKLIINLKE